jgi:hypothetical protein
MRGDEFLLFGRYGEQVQNLYSSFHPEHLDEALDGFGRHIFLLRGSNFQTMGGWRTAKSAWPLGFTLVFGFNTSGVASTEPQR